MPEEHRDRQPMQALVSPWLLGALALGWLVVLAMTVSDVGLVITAWVVTVGLIALIIMIRRKRGAVTDPAGSRRVDPHPTTARPGINALPVPAEFPLVLTHDEAAGLLRVDPDVILDAIRGHELPGNRIGVHWRVRTESLFTWLDGPYEAARRRASESATIPRSD